MTKRDQQARMRRRIARGWMDHGRRVSNVLDAVVSALRTVGPMNAANLQTYLYLQERYSVKSIDELMVAETARDWRSRRLRPATGYPDGYYISFDTNEDRR